MRGIFNRPPILGILLIALVFVTSAAAQTECPAGKICLSQAAANQAAEDHRVRAALEAEIAVLKQALLDKDKIIEDNKATAGKNEADLRDALHRTEVDLATKTGQLIGAEASNVRNLAIIDLLLKSVRPKKIGLINF